MSLKKQIPNSITLLNLLSGCIAVIFAVHNALEWAAFFAMAGIFFDFFDGFAARLLKVQSELGLQLDSLADMVTSGMVPGIVMYQLLAKVFPEAVWQVHTGFAFSYVGILGLCISLASAYRLAKFNIDTRQTSSFIGVPTPANTLLIISLPLIIAYQQTNWVLAVVQNPWFLIGLTVLSCYLLNAEIPLFALKFKTWGWKENQIRYVFLVLTLVLIGLLQFMAIPCIILLYVVLSVFANKTKSN